MTADRLQQMMDMSGRVALVTGGAGHVGRAAAAALAELGADVALADLADSRPAAEAVAGDFGVRACALDVDLADDTAARELPARTVSELGRLDVIVAAAAFVGTSALEGWAVPFEEQDPWSWRAALDVNLTSVFLTIQAAAPVLRESGNGSIVLLSSIYGMVGPDMRLYEGTDMGSPAAYAAGKGGLIQFTRWLATVLAPDIRVNAVSPGGLLRDQPPDFVQRYVERVPLGRMGVEDDVKGAIAFLASDLAAYVTGHNLVVDGGWTAW